MKEDKPDQATMLKFNYSRPLSLAQDPAHVLASESTYITTFSLIVAVNQPPSVLLPLADLAWQARSGLGIPLMSVRGAGMVGQVQVQVKEMGSE